MTNAALKQDAPCAAPTFTVISKNPEDVELWIQGSLRGDEDASAALLEYLYPHVIAIVRSRRPRRVSEEDLAQEVFIRVFHKLGQYSGKVPLKHWVSRISVNVCTNAYHKANASKELRLADLGEEGARVLEALAVSEDELEPSQSWAARELLEKLMASLSPDDRWLIDLICLKGFSYQQAREETGWNISAMKVRVFRARKKLEKSLKRLSEQRRATADNLADWSPFAFVPGAGLA